jgi:hypothetical protein
VNHRRQRLLTFVLAAVAFPVSAAGPFDLVNDNGELGLLQMPSGRSPDEGDFTAGISSARPYNQLHLSLQPLPWAGATLRYTAITTLPYVYQDQPSHQSYKDRSFDVRFKLLDEGEYQPALMLGFRDIGGTGLFASQYLAASRRWYDLDLTLGLGWERLGHRGSMPNPFRVLGSRFNDSSCTSASRCIFSGHDMGIFGGVTWRTPVNGLYVQAEYDGNNYQQEPKGTKLPVAAPVNAGLLYKLGDSFSAGLGYERGDRLTFRISLHGNFQRERGPSKLFDPRPLPAHYDQAAETARDSAAETLAPAAISPLEGEQLRTGLMRALLSQDLRLEALNIDQDQANVEVWFSQYRYRSEPKVIGRVARAVAALAPASIRSITVVNASNGVATYRVTLDRDQLARAADELEDTAALKASTRFEEADPTWRHADYPALGRYPAFGWTTGPALRQNIGGPEGFYFAQLWWKLGGDVWLTRHWNLSTLAGFNVYNNFGNLNLQSNSTLPHVRSDIIQYLKHGQDNIVSLETDYIWNPARNWYARLSGGIFEEMYGGVAGELLYRPFGEPWAVGVDINRLQQRDFNQLFDFRDYMVTTGYLTGYYRLPWDDILVKLSAGRYLARDRGATLDVSRRFRSGIVAGIFATKTNVSASQFGEGSFDKGVYLTVPLNLFFTQSSRTNASLLFRPLTRDGGQKAADGRELYQLIDGTDYHALSENWEDVLQ